MSLMQGSPKAGLAPVGRSPEVGSRGPPSQADIGEAIFNDDPNPNGYFRSPWTFTDNVLGWPALPREAGAS